jgi:hypothetical protein
MACVLIWSEYPYCANSASRRVVRPGDSVHCLRLHHLGLPHLLLELLAAIVEVG